MLRLSIMGPCSKSCPTSRSADGSRSKHCLIRNNLCGEDPFCTMVLISIISLLQFEEQDQMLGEDCKNRQTHNCAWTIHIHMVNFDMEHDSRPPNMQKLQGYFSCTFQDC